MMKTDADRDWLLRPKAPTSIALVNERQFATWSEQPVPRSTTVFSSNRGTAFTLWLETRIRLLTRAVLCLRFLVSGRLSRRSAQWPQEADAGFKHLLAIHQRFCMQGRIGWMSETQLHQFHLL
jgi:hypothetical protein